MSLREPVPMPESLLGKSPTAFLTTPGQQGDWLSRDSEREPLKRGREVTPAKELPVGRPAGDKAWYRKGGKKGYYLLL